MKNLKMFCTALVLILPLFMFAQRSLEGSWTTTFPGQDGSAVVAKLVIGEDGTYTVDFGADGQVEINGTYKTDGNQIIIRDMGEGPDACNGKGVYNFTVDDVAMVMERVSDECPNRGGEAGRMEFKREK